MGLRFWQTCECSYFMSSIIDVNIESDRSVLVSSLRFIFEWPLKLYWLQYSQPRIGAHFAETTMFLNISGILATFNVLKPVTKDGQEVEPEISFQSHGSISSVKNIFCCNHCVKLTFSLLSYSHPKPFDCRITPRAPDLLASLGVV